MGLVSPCTVSTQPLNTGHDCQVKMSATRMLIMVPRIATWTATNEQTFLTYIKARVHDVGNLRWFPLFGNSAPVRALTDSNEAEVTVKYDDGSEAFIRNGNISRIFTTNKGGMEFAKALQSFNKFAGGWAFIEIDEFNNVLRKQITGSTFSGVPCNMASAPTPALAGLKTEFLPAFALNFSAIDYIQKGQIASSDEDLLDESGLVLAQCTVGVGVQSATKLYFGVRTVNAQIDLVALYGAAMDDPTNYIVTRTDDGSHPSLSAGAIVAGEVELTGSFSTGKTYTVQLDVPSELLENSIEGYENSGSASLAVPA